MTAAKRVQWLVCCLVLTAGVAGVAHAVPNDARQSLVGLRNVSLVIVIDGVLPDSAAGVQQQLQIETELRLRKAGIRIVDHKSAGAELRVEVRVSKQDEGFYSYALFVELSEGVRLARNPGVTIHAPTWRVRRIDGAGIEVLAEVLRRWTEDLTNVFLNDYLAANPLR